MSPIDLTGVPRRPEPGPIGLAELMETLREAGFEPDLRWVGAQWFLGFGSFGIGAIDLREIPASTVRFIAQTVRKAER